MFRLLDAKVSHIVLTGPAGNKILSVSGKDKINIAVPIMEIMNISNFCKEINFPQKQYYDIVNFCKQNKGYISFKIPKKTGEKRTILAPNQQLKSLQTKIKDFIKNKYKPLNCCHGFIEKRSCITNATTHINKKWCLNLDLSDFFPTINFGRILGLFKSNIFSFDDKLATTLAIICCYKSKLPQGAPTSPILANMICYGLDKKMIELAKKNKCIYSRYADDITLSTNLNHFPRSLAIYNDSPSFVDLSPELYKTIADSGFIVNSAKTRLSGKNKCQMVTGIVVNKKLNLKRKYYRNLRAILFNCKKEGLLATAKRNGKQNETQLKNFILGKLSYYSSIVGQEHSSYNNLCKMYNQYIEYKFKNCIYNLDELNKNSLFILENDEEMTQGTAFLAKTNKLYTCKHCIIDITKDYPGEYLKIQLKNLENKIQVYNYQNPKNKYKVKNIRLFNADVAELELVDYNTEIKFQFSEDMLEIGEICTLIGFPNYSDGATPNIQTVSIASKRKHFGYNYFTIDKFIISGASGGPILNNKNEVVGIATNGGENPEEASKTDANMFYPISDIYTSL